MLRAGPDSLLWTASLAPIKSFAKPLVSHYVRKRGRPKKEWVPSILDEVYRRKALQTDIMQLAIDKLKWQSELRAN